MKRYFLFRLDGSKDNDYFSAQRRDKLGAIPYSGTTMSVGPGWVPDLIKVEMDDASTNIIVTLVELEAAAVTARVACRKFLPEPSDQIVRAFMDYLETVVIECRRRTDLRLQEFESLKRGLASYSAGCGSRAE